MKGLLYKDFCVLQRQSKLLLLIILVFALLPGSTMSSFAVYYAALLPITALAYDERAKWDELAATMPYTAFDLVFSKYLLCYIFLAAAAVAALAAQYVTAFFTKASFGGEAAASLAVVCCIALCFLAIDLPMMFRMGVEKGRLAFIVVTVGILVVSMSFSDSLKLLLTSDSSPAALAAVPAAAVILNALSVLLSVKIYRVKRG